MRTLSILSINFIKIRTPKSLDQWTGVLGLDMVVDIFQDQSQISLNYPPNWHSSYFAWEWQRPTQFVELFVGLRCWGYSKVNRAYCHPCFFVPTSLFLYWSASAVYCCPGTRLFTTDLYCAKWTISKSKVICIMFWYDCEYFWCYLHYYNALLCN